MVRTAEGSAESRIEAAALRLSILDQSPVVGGANPAQAIGATIELARHAERLGYYRYWLAEHHGRFSFADGCPEVLIARIIAETSTLRLGTGGVLLTHYSAYKVAETFHMLEALAPGRIDLGIGRATGSDERIAMALRNYGPPLDYIGQLSDLLGLIDPARADEGILVTPLVEQVPDVWLLGSSDYSALVAAEMGVPFAHAHFIAGDAPESVRQYRGRFKPSARFAEPRVLLAVAAIATDDDAEVEVFRRALGLWRARVRLEHQPAFPSRDEARSHVPTPREELHIADSARRSVIGRPLAVRERLEHVAAAHGADELMIITITPDYRSRLASYELLARAFGLDGAAG
jgi:luciferase family oxidoreductase group 1